MNEIESDYTWIGVAFGNSWTIAEGSHQYSYSN